MARKDEICESAVFTGEDGSCGLRHGERYNLRVLIRQGQVYIGRQGGDAMIPYDTMSALLKNWDFRRYVRSEPQYNADGNVKILKQFKYGGWTLRYCPSGWEIVELEKMFPTSQEAEAWIRSRRL